MKTMRSRNAIKMPSTMSLAGFSNMRTSVASSSVLEFC
jgi:hypothetical protein